MKFSAEDIKKITFPSGAMGYKKKDVDDFLSYVTKDYRYYQQMVKNLKEELEEELTEKERLAELSENQRATDLQKIDELNKELKVLKRQLLEMQVSNRSSRSGETMELSLSQKVALKIEEQAQEEAQRIRQEADAYYQAHVTQLRQEKNQLDWRIRNGLVELTKNERMLSTSVDRLKQEYLELTNDLRSHYEAMMEEEHADSAGGEVNVF